PRAPPERSAAVRDHVRRAVPVLVALLSGCGGGSSPTSSTGPSPSPPASGLDYGSSRNQVAQIRVPEVHALGLHGEGVVVAMLDTGFDTLSHESLARLRIAARHDFVSGDDDVGGGPAD